MADIDLGDAVIFEIEEVRKYKKMIRWCLNNVDSLIEFFSEPFPIQVLEPVNKDRLLLDLVASVSSNSTINKVLTGMYDINELVKYLDKPQIIASLNYVNNYKLMIDYLNSENDSDYYIEMKITVGDVSTTISSNDVLESFEEINKPLRENSEYSKKIG